MEPRIEIIEPEIVRNRTFSVNELEKLNGTQDNLKNSPEGVFRFLRNIQDFVKGICGLLLLAMMSSALIFCLWLVIRLMWRLFKELNPIL